MAHLPGKPFTLDNYHSLQTDAVCEDGCPPAPSSVESIVPSYLGRQHRQDRLQADRERARR